MGTSAATLSGVIGFALTACSSPAAPAGPRSAPAGEPRLAAPSGTVALAPAQAAIPSEESMDTEEVIRQSWNFSDPKESERRFRELSRAAIERGDVTAALELDTQAARAQGLDRRMDEARATLERVEAKLAGQPARVQVRLLLERGRVLNSSGQPESARPLFEQAWKLAGEDHLDGLAVDAAHMVAIALLSNPDEAIAWNDKALALARASTQASARRWLGSLLNNQGWSHFEKREYAAALRLFEEALQVRSEQSNEPATRIAKWSVGKAQRALGEIERALAIQQALLSEHTRIGEADGFVFEELGECHLAKGDTKLAKEYFAKAYSELSKDPDFVQAEAKRLERMGVLGGLR
jgi:tetratricopeptide (TPR) repeat protein